MAYSHRTDPAVPEFDDVGLRTVMDAQCALCAQGARWIARNDTAKVFRIIPLQSDLGRALMIHYGMDPEDPTSWLFLDNGQPETSAQAVFAVAQKLGGLWGFLSVFNWLPKTLTDWMYRLVARNRYRWFGRGDMCALPDPAVQERLMR